jgi:hypothetical protein
LGAANNYHRSTELNQDGQKEQAQNEDEGTRGVRLCNNYVRRGFVQRPTTEGGLSHLLRANDCKTVLERFATSRDYIVRADQRLRNCKFEVERRAYGEILFVLREENLPRLRALLLEIW